MDFTDGRPTPEICRLWCGISCLAGALERRVYVVNNVNPVYPNLYIMLVTPSAIGKSVALSPVKDLWFRAKGLTDASVVHLGADSATKASLLDDLESAKIVRMVSDGNGGQMPLEYNAISLALPEIGTFLAEYDKELISVLTALWDNEPWYRETRRTVKNTTLVNPILNILTGTQPNFMSSLIPDIAWGQGFMARVIMVYASNPVKVDIWDKSKKPDPAKRAKLLVGLSKVLDLSGELQVTDEAIELYRDWCDKNYAPAPEHIRLQAYRERRNFMWLKLSIIAAVSRGCDGTLQAGDLDRARNWLLDVEARMPDIFRAMAGKSDNAAMLELWFYVDVLEKKTKRPVHESQIYQYLAERIPSGQIQNIFGLAIACRAVEKLPDNYYHARPKVEWQAGSPL